MIVYVHLSIQQVKRAEVVLNVKKEKLRITTMRHRIERAKQLIRRHVKPGASLVDELIAERRKAAERE